MRQRGKLRRSNDIDEAESYTLAVDLVARNAVFVRLMREAIDQGFERDCEVRLFERSERRSKRDEQKTVET
jgi:hypothetical protein